MTESVQFRRSKLALLNYACQMRKAHRMCIYCYLWKGITIGVSHALTIAE